MVACRGVDHGTAGDDRQYPQGLAVVATAVRIKEAEAREKKRAIEKEKLIKEAKGVIKTLSGLEVTLTKKASAKGKLYAALSEKAVLDAVREKANVGLEPEHWSRKSIKEVGEHEVEVTNGEKIQKMKLLLTQE